CIVCYSDIPADQFPRSGLSPLCMHPMRTCITCLQKFIRVSVDAVPRLAIMCTECSNPLSELMIQRYADGETMQKIRDMELRVFLSLEKDFVWCASGCGNGQLHAGGSNKPIVTCNQCGKRTCFAHKCQWHAGLTCEEWDAVLKEDEQALVEQIHRARDERASELYLEKSKAKKCPRCGRWIEKNGGW
ncbi:hypothetical protein QBC44DRAFT_244056, partial [Cladorrhinum sp. PSN332]